MPQVEAIQILLNIKTTGDEAVKKLIAQFNSLTKNLLSTAKTDQMVENLVTSIEKNIPKIIDIVSNVTDQVSERILQKGSAVFTQLETLTMRKGNKLVQVAGQSSGQAYALALAVPTAITQGIVPALGKINGTISQIKGGSFSLWQFLSEQAPKAANAAGQAIETRWLTPILSGIKGAKTILSTFFNFEKIAISSLEKGTGLLGAMQAIFSNVYSGAVGLFTLVGRSKFNSYFFNEAKTFLGRLIGIGPSMLSPLERIQRIVVTIDSALHGTHNIVGSIFKAAFTGVAAFYGPFAGIMSKLAFANTIMTTISNAIQPNVLRVQTFFGNQQAKIRLIIMEARDVIYALLDKMKKDGNAALLIGEKFAKEVDPKKAKGFFGELSGLSGMKFPLPQQIQLMMAEVRPFIQQITKQLFAIVESLHVGLKIGQADIAVIQQKATTSLDGVKTKAQDSFLFVKREIGKFWEASGLAIWWQTSELAKGIRLPFELLTKVGKVVLGIANISFVVPIKGVQKFLEISESIVGKLMPAFNKFFSFILAKTGSIFSFFKGGFNLLRSLFAGIGNIFSNVVNKFRKPQEQQVGRPLGKTESQDLTAFKKVISSVDSKQLKDSGVDIDRLKKSFEGFFNSLQTVSAGKMPTENILAFKNAMLALIQVGGQATSDLGKRLKDLFGYSNIELSPKMAKEINKFVADITQNIQTLASKGKISGSTGDAIANMLVGELSGKGLTVAKNRLHSIMSVLFSGIRVENSGKKITDQLASGITQGNKTVADAMNKTAEQTMDYIPQSPAKKGPFKNLVSSGYKISQYLSNGVVNGKGLMQKSAHDVAEIFAKHFPRSLPVLGPLIALPMMGWKIPFYLAQGIMSGIGMIQESAGQIADVVRTGINEVIAKSHELRKAAFATGLSVEKVSELEFALKSLGSTTQDAVLPLTKINDLLITATEDDYRKLSYLSIDLDEFRKSATPALDIFRSLIKVIGTADIQSKEFQTSLSLLGLTSQSTLVPAIRASGGELDSLMKKAADGSVTMSDKFGELTEKVHGIETQWAAVKESLFANLVEPILPEISKLSDRLFEFWSQIAPVVQTVMSITGNAISKVLNLLFTFLNFARSEPVKALGFLKTAVTTSGNLIWVTVKNLLSDISGRILSFFFEIQWSIASVTGTIIKETFDQILQEIGTSIENIKKAIAPYVSIASIGGKKVEISPAVQVFKQKTDGKYFTPDQIKAMDEEKAKDSPTAKLLKDVEKTDKELAEKNKKTFVERMTKIFTAAQKEAGDQIKILNDSINKKLGEGLSKKTTEEINKEYEEFVKTIGTAVSVLPEDVQKSMAEMANAVDPKEILAQWDLAMQEVEKRKAQKEKAQEQPKIGVQETISGQFGFSQEKTQSMSDFFTQVLAGIRTEAELTANVFQNLGDVMAGLFEASGKKAKAFFFIEKAVSVAQATVRGALAVLSALSDATVPSVALRVANAAMIGATTGVQIGKIIASTIQGYATGGKIPGQGDRDSVPAMLTPGEFVQPKNTVATYGVQFMESLRQRAIPKSAIDALMGNLSMALPNPSYKPQLAFAMGGPVMATMTNPPMAQTQQQQPINIVNITSQSEFDRYMASSQGQKMVLNAIQRDPIAFRRIISREA